MCRLLGYLGSAIQLDKLLYKPEHSLVTQSYQPREMTAGLLNADGFGVGWFDLQKDIQPYIYKNILPIWNDVNLPHLSRYVESECILSYVRSATAPVAVDFSNCQPFNYDRILFIHNGFIHNFRQTLYRPIRTLLSDEAYHCVTGTTDSEHIFALIISELQKSPDISLEFALNQALRQLNQLSEKLSTYFSANIILSDGKQLVACRYANRYPIPTLYWIKNQSPSSYPESVIVASEPLFEGNWQSCPENSIIKVGEDLTVDISTVS